MRKALTRLTALLLTAALCTGLCVATGSAARTDPVCGQEGTEIAEDAPGTGGSLLTGIGIAMIPLTAGWVTYDIIRKKKKNGK